MQLDSSEDAITYFLKHKALVSETGVADTDNRERAARLLQSVSDQYWESAGKRKEATSTVQFSGSTGLAGLPSNFETWDQDFGNLVWGPPNTTYRYEFNPTKQPAMDVMTLRAKNVDRTGVPIAVVMHEGLLKRWPTLPPSGANEDVTIFYHRNRPNILDLFGVEDLPGPDDPQDEWEMFPVSDQNVLIDGLDAKWKALAADGRETQAEAMFRKRVRELHKKRNQDQQPRRMSKPFNPRFAGRPTRTGW